MIDVKCNTFMKTQIENEKTKKNFTQIVGTWYTE